MRNIKIVFQYDGRNYFGLQKQKNKKTIQGEIENALFEVFKQKINITLAGRTDRGVSAKAMCANFFVDSDIDDKKITYPLNFVLPPDIRILSSIEKEQNFHARFDAKRKTYVYGLYVSNFSLPLYPFETQFKTKLNFGAMRKAIKFFVGEKDFSCCTTNVKENESCVRKIFSAKLKRQVIDGVEHFYFTFVGNGFLYNQVRAMVGTTILAGLGKVKPKEIKKIIESKNRALGGKVMPPEGLVLEKIEY